VRHDRTGWEATHELARSGVFIYSRGRFQGNFAKQKHTNTIPWRLSTSYCTGAVGEIWEEVSPPPPCNIASLVFPLVLILCKLDVISQV
jgi:hypothetical protein